MEQLILLKFGKKEHLESLRNGNIYFSPVSKYREDLSLFRGDADEGAVPINPKTLKINNIDFSDIINTVRKTYVGDEDILMFCASMVNEKVLVSIGDSYFLKEEFKETVSQFGDHVLVFNFQELIGHLRDLKKKSILDIAWRTGKVSYRNMNDFNSQEYRETYGGMNSVLDPFLLNLIHI